MRSVRVPHDAAGTYRVRVEFDSGPLAGLLVDEQLVAVEAIASEE